MFNDHGHLVTGLSDGSIVTIDPVSGERTVLGNTGGRPLGVEPCTDGSVLVCDHDRGLLRMSGGGSVEVLVEKIGQEKLRFASNVVHAEDGTIWFTSSTSRWDLNHYQGDLLEHSCTGRLVQRDPDGTLAILAADLSFANGLVLAPDGSHLLYAETSRYQISRFWLTGPKRGSSEPFHTNLPGFPDNMSLGSDGLLWAAIAAPRNPLLDALLPLPGLLRVLVWNLPERFQPAPSPIAWVMAFDLEGRVIHDLRTSDGSYGFTTTVAERNGTLVLGSLNEEHLAMAAKPRLSNRRGDRPARLAAAAPTQHRVVDGRREDPSPSNGGRPARSSTAQGSQDVRRSRQR
jgi:sugar lactone lactonase YvrE